MTQTTPRPETREYRITPQQRHYFDTFGFLAIPGLFADDIGELTDAFERVFTNEEQPKMETNEYLHLDEKRVIIPGFLHKDPRLAQLLDDGRVNGVVDGLMDGKFEYAESDGNLFYCESSWHPDTYSAPLHRYHVKLSFYLDSLTGESGAIRLIPGTNHHKTPFAKMLRNGLDDHAEIENRFGVPYNEIPSWTLKSEPGDLVVWNFRTIHASFNGGERRRLFSINFREPEIPEAPAA
jgi:hypothetical protein